MASICIYLVSIFSYAAFEFVLTLFMCCYFVRAALGSKEKDFVYNVLFIVICLYKELRLYKCICEQLPLGIKRKRKRGKHKLSLKEQIHQKKRRKETQEEDTENSKTCLA
jgi:hypothetical protein